MKKLGFAIIALSAISLALPSIASAETIVVKRGGDHHRWQHSRAEFHPHRDWHPRHHDRVVVIKRHHRY